MEVFESVSDGIIDKSIYDFLYNLNGFDKKLTNNCSNFSRTGNNLTP